MLLGLTAPDSAPASKQQVAQFQNGGKLITIMPLASSVETCQRMCNDSTSQVALLISFQPEWRSALSEARLLLHAGYMVTSTHTPFVAYN